MSKDFAEAIQRTAEEKLEWLEDIIAGLMAAGVREDEIQIQEHPDLRTVVCVRGEPKYQFRINLKT